MDGMDGMDVDPPVQRARSTSPIAFPSSSNAHPSSDPPARQPQPLPLAHLRSSGTNPRSSSPLAFPSSSAGGSARGPAQSGQRLFASGGPSSDARNGQRYRGDSPLFFPGSEFGSPTPRRNHRGDIHSAAPPTPSARSAAHPTSTARRTGANGAAPSSELGFPASVASQRSDAAGGGGAGGGDPSSTGPGLGARDDDEEDEDGDGLVTVLWGTTVTIGASMRAFARFLKEFTCGDRQTYDPWRLSQLQAQRTRLETELNRAQERGQLDEVAALRQRLDLLLPDSDINFAYSRERPDKKLYQHYLARMRDTGQTNLNLDVEDLQAFRWQYIKAAGPGGIESKDDRDFSHLYRNFILYPQELVPILDQQLKDSALEWACEESNLGYDGMERMENEQRAREMHQSVFKVRPYAGENRVNMRDLNPQDIDKIVCIKGLVIRATPIIPDMKLAFFRCNACSHTVTVEIDRGKIAEPDRCPRDVCNLQGSMLLVHNRCEFADRQIVRLQETPDSVPDGQTPHTVSLGLYDELVDTVKPGDRVTITGIFRSVPVRLNPRQRVIKSLFKTYVDVLHVKKTDKKRMGLDGSTRGGAGEDRRGVVGVGMEEEQPAGDDDEDDERERDEEEFGAAGTGGASDVNTQARLKEKLVEISRRDDIYEYLSRSLAPSIFEMDDVKKGILLQLFGGTNKSLTKGGGAGGPRYRGDINVLLVGDPGTSKSQILQYVHKIAPRGVYTSGKGSSAVGLTAYVTRDPDSKQLVLESGALVLSDGGVCCIDEFDKMSDATRSVLHEVMEQQTVSIAKAGIITTLNARTSILAAANPVGSKYNLNWPITRNIDLPPTLISRFDLLYLVLDKIDDKSDRMLAKHLVGLYLEDRPQTAGTDIMKIEDLSAYISFARNHIHPVLTPEASQALVQAYVEMRNAGADARTNDRRITATTRQLESMIRLSEAHARMRYSEQVQVEDVEEANRLIREALKESATDPLTGLIDLDLLGGQSTHQRKLRSDLRREVVALLGHAASSRGYKWSDLAKALEQQSAIPVDQGELSDVVKALEGEGSVRVSGQGLGRMVKLVGNATQVEV